MADRSQHAARVEGPVGRRKEELAHLEDRDEAPARPVLVQDRQHANAFVVHDPERLGHGGLL